MSAAVGGSPAPEWWVRRTVTGTLVRFDLFVVYNGDEQSYRGTWSVNAGIEDTAMVAAFAGSGFTVGTVGASAAERRIVHNPPDGAARAAVAGELGRLVGGDDGASHDDDDLVPVPRGVLARAYGQLHRL